MAEKIIWWGFYKCRNVNREKFLFLFNKFLFNKLSLLELREKGNNLTKKSSVGHDAIEYIKMCLDTALQEPHTVQLKSLAVSNSCGTGLVHQKSFNGNCMKIFKYTIYPNSCPRSLKKICLDVYYCTLI